MLWSLLCYKLGILENTNIGTYLPCGMVFDSTVLEESVDFSSELEDFDDKADLLLNTAFIKYVDCEEYDTDTECMLEEDYDY